MKITHGIVFYLLAPLICAQANAGTLSGTVTDAEGK